MNQIQPIEIFLCRLEDLEKTGAKTIPVEGESETVLVVATAENEIKAYASRCPHMGVPLETFPDHVLDQQREFIVCSTHGARFQPATGECVRGPCRGDYLEPHQIRIEEEKIFLIRP